jgi:simple sugar transport system permease protein
MTLPPNPSPIPALTRAGLRLLAAALMALALTVLAVLPTGASPWDCLAAMAGGALGSPTHLAQTLASFCPLVICAQALLLTFAAGLWNIGMEGQIAMGAVASVALCRWLGPSGGAAGPILGQVLALAAAMAGGALWAFIPAWLKTRGRVHEIFSGLGLNFVAVGLNIWLIFGPWKRPGIASMSGTEPLARSWWLAGPGLGSSLTWAAMGAALAVILAVALVLGRTRLGLVLKAVGQNPEAARARGLAPDQRTVLALMACGALAGLTGGLLALGSFHRLVPSISSGYGYTGILAALTAGLAPLGAVLACLVFASLSVGAVQLPLTLGLDSSLAGVIQGLVVLSFFVVGGIEVWLLRRRKG